MEPPRIRWVFWISCSGSGNEKLMKSICTALLLLLCIIRSFLSVNLCTRKNESAISESFIYLMLFFNLWIKQSISPMLFAVFYVTNLVIPILFLNIHLWLMTGGCLEVTLKRSLCLVVPLLREKQCLHPKDCVHSSVFKKI